MNYINMNKVELYDNLINDVGEVICEAERLEVAHENIEPIKRTLLEGLKHHQKVFKINAINAKELSEWNKYTIAFFGETNAGKSTIIESLRIIGKEKSKLLEYDQIEKIKNKISKIKFNIKSFEQFLITAEKEIVFSINNLRKKKETLENVNKEILVYTAKLNTEKIGLYNLEQSMNFVKVSIKASEDKLYLFDQQKQTINKEIFNEEQLILKREKALTFIIKRWFGKLFGRNVVVDNLFLKKLKKDEFEIEQYSKEHQDELVLFNVKKVDIDSSLIKTNEHIQEYQSTLQKLLIETEIINGEITDLNKTIFNANKNIECYKVEIENKEALVLEKENELNTLGDGKIIGTGKQDYTVDVNSYELEYNNQSVILIDVPGIEGNEDKYTNMIKNAVSKAHAIFYVNGSNKKPEEKTLEKIKTYLQDQTEVYSISNVKGKADSYEFEDERIHLMETHKDLNKTVELTKGILNSVLDNKYKGHLNIQGLLAFVASSKHIIPNRIDLTRNSKSFFKHFETSEQMRDFSNLVSIESLISEQQPFFKNKIKVANLQTMIGIASRFIGDLEHFQKHIVSDDSIKQVEREINNYQNEVKVDIVGLESSFGNISNRLANEFYNQLQSFLHFIIDKKFDEAFSLFSQSNNIVKQLLDRLKPKGKDKEALEEFVKIFIEQLTDKVQSDFQKGVQNKLKNFFEGLQNKKKKVSTRLSIINNSREDEGILGSVKVDIESLSKGFNYMDILKEGFNVLTTVGGMAVTGAAIGSFFPVVGNMIGAVIGAIFGAIFYGVKSFFGGETKEAKIKRELEPKLKEAKKEILSYFEKMCKNSYKEVEENTNQEGKVLNLCSNGLRELQRMLINKVSDINSLIHQVIKEKETIEKTYINTELN